MQRTSVATAYAADHMTELVQQNTDLAAQVKPEEWYNIPEPIKNAFEGLLAMQNTLTTAMIMNAEIAHKKVLQVQSKTRALEHTVTKGFDHIDNSLQQAVKKLSGEHK